MKKVPAAGLSVAAFAAVAIAAGPASAITFEPEPCVITLAPSYVSMPAQDITVPGSAVTCPPAFTSFNLTTGATSMDVYFNGVPGTATTDSAFLSNAYSKVVYDPAVNGIVTTREIRLYGAPGTYTAVNTANTGGMYLTDTTPNPDTYYRLVLARPFTITAGLPATPTCTLTMAPAYTYVWGQGQGNQYPVPDSAISCTGGITYNSGAYIVNGVFDSRYQDQAYLSTQSQSVYNPATRTYRVVDALWLVPKSSANTQRAAERREMGLSDPANNPGANSAFGRFTSGPSGLSVVSKADYVTTYALTLAAPFTIKRRTDVTATAKRTKKGMLAITISADRNASFSNTVAQTYRRQTVLPDTPADHAVVRRGSTVLKRVKLSPYGKGSVTVRDAKGRNAYSVTMVATNDNYAGVARFRR